MLLLIAFIEVIWIPKHNIVNAGPAVCLKVGQYYSIAKKQYMGECYCYATHAFEGAMYNCELTSDPSYGPCTTLTCNNPTPN